MSYTNQSSIGYLNKHEVFSIIMYRDGKLNMDNDLVPVQNATV